MVSTQSAMNSLNRVLEYVNQTADVTTMYQKGVENLKQIREIASQILRQTDNMLQLVDEFDPQPIQTHSDEALVKIASEAASSAVINVLNQLNIIGEQNIHADTVIQYNSVESTEIDEKPQAVPNSNITKYKSIIKEVSEIGEDSFASELSYNCASLCNMYFNTRFNLTYDINRIHRFDKKQLKNYIASIIIAYADSYESGGLVEFESEVYNWCQEVVKGVVRYTLPKSAATIFFKIIKNQPLEISKESIQTAKQIWNDLWILGYSKLNTKCLKTPSEYLPVYDLSWIEEFDSTIDVINYLDNNTDIEEDDLIELSTTVENYLEYRKGFDYLDRWESILSNNTSLYSLIDTKTRIIPDKVVLDAICNYLQYVTTDKLNKDILSLISNWTLSKTGSPPELLKVYETYLDNGDKD